MPPTDQTPPRPTTEEGRPVRDPCDWAGWTPLCAVHGRLAAPPSDQEEPPATTDVQRRCWTTTENRQCGLFNAHPGDHQFGELGRWLHHFEGCGWHTGKGCDCGLAAIHHSPLLQPIELVEGNDGQPWIRWAASTPVPTLDVERLAEELARHRAADGRYVPLIIQGSDGRDRLMGPLEFARHLARRLSGDEGAE